MANSQEQTPPDTKHYEDNGQSVRSDVEEGLNDPGDTQKNLDQQVKDKTYIMSSDGVLKEQPCSDENSEEDKEEDLVFAQGSDNNESRFDQIIGCIEDIVIDERFQDLQESLISSSCGEFDENAEENKLIYTDIFHNYTKTVEEYIEQELDKRIEGFNMKSFIKDLESKRADLEGEVFDLLFTLTDFLAFKEMMIDYKLMKNCGALDELLCINGL